MVGITEISAVVAAAGVVVGIVYYAVEMRHQTKVRETDLVMRWSRIWVGNDFLEAWARVMERDPREHDKSSPNKFSEWIPEIKIGSFFNDIGFLVHKGLADIELVDNIFPVKAAWEKLQPGVMKIRTYRSDPTYYEWLEYLYKEVTKREQKLQQSTSKGE